MPLRGLLGTPITIIHVSLILIVFFGNRPVVTKRDILDEYLELFNDEEDIVREAALTEFVRLLTPPTNLEGGGSQDLGYLEKAFSQFSLRSRKFDFGGSEGTMFSDDGGNGLTLIDAETKINMVIPTWKKLCSEKSTRLLPILCREFGLFLFCTMDVMKEDDFEWFLNWFQKASTMKELELKTNCAFNLPVNFHDIFACDYTWCSVLQSVFRLLPMSTWRLQRNKMPMSYK